LPAITGAAGALYRVACFAVVRHSGKPAPTEKPGSGFDQTSPLIRRNIPSWLLLHNL